MPTSGKNMYLYHRGMPEPSTYSSETDAMGGAAAPSGGAKLGRQGKGLAHEVVESIKSQLRNGAIKPGDKLPSESEFMQTFGVSRGVVREALSRLGAAGFVQTHHGIGTFALEVSTGGKGRLEVSSVEGFAAMLELLELRTSIESDAAALAAVRRSDEHLREMLGALHDFERHLSELGETVAPDFRFHLAIAQATGNRYFSELTRQLGTAVIPRTRVSSSWLDAEQRAPHLLKVNQEHQDIFAAIERRDPEAARAAMRIHLVNSRERQRAAYAEAATGGNASPPSQR
jgi:GntR family transcriptional regulator, transcriptional repressor for pyruvate dehydrogenase complex